MSRAHRQERLAAAAPLSIVLAGLASLAWWRGWFYEGWPAASGLLVAVFGADGEAAYDALALEMFLLAAALLLPSIYWRLGRIRSRHRRVLAPAGRGRQQYSRPARHSRRRRGARLQHLHAVRAIGPRRRRVKVQPY